MQVIPILRHRVLEAIALAFGATVLAAAVPFAALAQELSKASAEEVGLSSSRLTV